MTEDGGQKTDDRKQRTEEKGIDVRRQLAEVNAEFGLRPIGVTGAYAPEGSRKKDFGLRI